MSANRIHFLQAVSRGLAFLTQRTTIWTRSVIVLATLVVAASRLPGQVAMTSGQVYPFSSKGVYSCTGSGLMPVCYLSIGMFTINVPQGATQLEVSLTSGQNPSGVMARINSGSTMTHTVQAGYNGNPIGSAPLQYALSTTDTGSLVLTPGNWVVGLDTTVIGIFDSISISGTILANVWFSTPPTITSISPSAAASGGQAFTLTVNGTQFVSSSIVQWNGSPLVTNYVSATQLTASAPAGLITSLATANVTVQDTGGPLSNSVAFTIAPSTGNAYLISTVAGTGAPGYSGDGGKATAAAERQPNHVAADNSGNFYIAEFLNNCVRKVSNGIITTVAGTGTSGFSGDGGPATSARLNGPTAVAVDAAGNIYIADYGNNRIRKVAPDGVITTLAGTGSPGYSGDGGPATSALINSLSGLRADAAGNLFFTQTSSHVVRKVDANGIISTVAGNGAANSYGDGGPATSAALESPGDVAVDAAGNIYVVDYGTCSVRRIGTDGVITTVAGGTGCGGFAEGDKGPATAAVLAWPEGVDVDSAGNIFIADTGSSVIREVTTDGKINTIAGRILDGYAGDGGPATKASLSSPYGVNVGLNGSLYISDSKNNVVRLLTPQLSVPPILSIAFAHPVGFEQGQTGAIDTVVVSNAFTAGPTSGTVTVVETLPPGLTLIGMAGTGWSCQASTCSRSDPLNGATSYPPITVTMSVAATAPSQVSNQATVSGGGSTSATATGTTTIYSPIALSGTTLPFGFVGGAYATALTVSGGVAPFAWAVASGNLPNGLSLDAANGNLSGTPSASGAFSFQVKVRDSTGASSTASFQLTVTPVLVTFTANPNPIIAASGIGMTTLTWNAPGYSQLVITVGSPAGTHMTGTLATSGSVPTGNWVTDGMQFFLVDLTAQSAIASLTVHISQTGTPPPSGITFTANPNPIIAASGMGMTTLTWNAPGYSQLVITVGSATGIPMTGTLATSGSVPTGNWVTDGMQFLLVDLTTRSSIASLTVHLRSVPATL